MPFTRVVYIERTDFRTEDAEDYNGLAPGKTVIDAQVQDQGL